MARAYRNVMQPGEIVFCNSSSSMDRFNTSIFNPSTTTACSGIPLAAVRTSDETEETVTWAMEKVKEVIPSNAFYGNGPGLGPAVFMIDDSVVEQAPLSKCWPMAKIFLCTFHFLQRCWTWLYDGKNRILKEDRVVLIQHIRSMVYSNTEGELGSNYSSLISLEIACKYPHFLKNINGQWEKRTF